MRILPVGPHVELPVRYDPCEACAELGGGTPCELCLWQRRWSSRESTIRARGVPKLAGGRYVNPAFSGAVGGASWGARSVCRMFRNESK